MTELLRDVARRYYAAGLNVLPAIRKEKRPALRAWKKYVETRPAFEEVFPESARFDALCVVCGKTSGGLEILDFDQQGRAFGAFREKVPAKFLTSLPTESTQSGGRHVAFRSDACGRNQKLARNNYGVTIETRGEGGICLIAPSPGYELAWGDWERVPNICAEDREKLLDAARALDAAPRTGQELAPPNKTQASTPSQSETVADYLRGNLQLIRDALTRAGWELIRVENEYEYWKRPGQTVADRAGGSLNVETGNFHCFTSNANPLTVDGNYTPLKLVAALEYGGDVSAASRAYGKSKSATARFVKIDCYNPFDEAPRQTEKKPQKEVAFPEELYECDGLIQEFQELTNKYAIRSQPEGAFLGALATFSYLAGRSIAVAVNGYLTPPNLYALFLAPSGMGKEIIRRVGSEVARVYSPSEAATESFASVQALQNLITRRKKVFWLHDEFGRDLNVMSGDRVNANVSSILTECLKLYSSANSRAYLPKLVAQEAKGVKKPDPVDRPHLTIFATGNPREFYDATSESILANGYLARFTTVLGRSYSEKREIEYEEAMNAPVFEIGCKLQERIWAWSNFEKRTENGFQLVGCTREAFDVIRDFDREIEKSIRNDANALEGSVEFKARLSEKVWKYALNFAGSCFGCLRPFEIGKRQARQAVALARYEHALFDANLARYANSAQSKLEREIFDWATAIGGVFTKTEFTRKFQRKGSLRERKEALETLCDGGYLEEAEMKRADGSFMRGYRALE